MPVNKGNLTDCEINSIDHKVKYDLDNRIIKVKIDTTEVNYRYDALGRRVIRKQKSVTKTALIWWGNSECARKIIKQASAILDGFYGKLPFLPKLIGNNTFWFAQSSLNTAHHAMRRRGQSVAQATLEYQKFVKAQKDKALELANEISQRKGEVRCEDTEKALLYIGFAFHAISDSTSPSHQGFQEWGGLRWAATHLGEVKKHTAVEGPTQVGKYMSETTGKLDAYLNKNIRYSIKIRILAIFLISITFPSCGFNKPPEKIAASKIVNKHKLYSRLSSSDFSVFDKTFLIHGGSRTLHLKGRTYSGFTGLGIIYVSRINSYLFGTERFGVNYFNIVNANSGKRTKIKTEYSFANNIGANPKGYYNESILNFMNSKCMLFTHIPKNSSITYTYNVDLERKTVTVK